MGTLNLEFSNSEHEFSNLGRLSHVTQASNFRNLQCTILPLGPHNSKFFLSLGGQQCCKKVGVGCFGKLKTEILPEKDSPFDPQLPTAKIDQYSYKTLENL